MMLFIIRFHVSYNMVLAAAVSCKENLNNFVSEVMIYIWLYFKETATYLAMKMLRCSRPQMPGPSFHTLPRFLTDFFTAVSIQMDNRYVDAIM